MFLCTPLPLWIFRRFPETLHMQSFDRHQVPETHLRAIARPYRHPHIVPHGFSGIEVPRVDYEKLSSDRLGESSASIRERVQAARERQRVRFKGSDIVCNSDMRVAEVRKFCKLDEAGDSLVRAAMSQLNLSARGYHRVLKLARTIADLAGSEGIQPVHLAEALQYRPKLMIG
jgi:hypothetical protein